MPEGDISILDYLVHWRFKTSLLLVFQSAFGNWCQPNYRYISWYTINRYCSFNGIEKSYAWAKCRGLRFCLLISKHSLVFWKRPIYSARWQILAWVRSVYARIGPTFQQSLLICWECSIFDAVIWIWNSRPFVWTQLKLIEDNDHLHRKSKFIQN
jgi:hypothetical protein